MSELPHVVCRRVGGAGTLQADSTSAPWRDLPAFELVLAATAAEPLLGTWVRMGWTDTEWRVLFDAVDPDPWATLTERDAPLYQEETVEIFCDPVGDLESYYEFEVNPLGTELDIVFRRSRSGYKGDWAWNCEGLRSKVCRTAHGWAAEWAIPFAGFAEPPRLGTVWRANFCRIERPSRDGSLPRELTAWSPPLRETFHTPERFGRVEFIA